TSLRACSRSASNETAPLCHALGPPGLCRPADRSVLHGALGRRPQRLHHASVGCPSAGVVTSSPARGARVGNRLAAPADGKLRESAGGGIRAVDGVARRRRHATGTGMAPPPHPPPPTLPLSPSS